MQAGGDRIELELDIRRNTSELCPGIPEAPQCFGCDRIHGQDVRQIQAEARRLSARSEQPGDVVVHQPTRDGDDLYAGFVPYLNSTVHSGLVPQEHGQF